MRKTTAFTITVIMLLAFAVYFLRLGNDAAVWTGEKAEAVNIISLVRRLIR